MKTRFSFQISNSGLLFLLWGLMVSWCAPASAQEEQKSLDKVLRQLSRKQEVFFAYDELLIGKYKVYPPADTSSTEVWLREVLPSCNLQFRQINETFVIYRAPEASAARESAPSITVQGTVRDAQTGEPLPYATLSIPHSNRFAVTDAEGNFSLLQIPPAGATVTVSYLGYAGQEIKVRPDDAGRPLDLRLSAKAETLSTITVTSSPTEVIDDGDETGHYRLNARQIGKLSMLGEPDPFRQVQLLPGVSAGAGSDAGLVIRGGTPEQSLVLFDDFTVYHIDHLYGIYSAFNAGTIQDMQLYKSGFAARYGGRVNGVLDIVGKQGNQEEVSGSISANMINVNGVLEVPVGEKFTLLVAGRRAYTDWYQTGLYRRIFRTIEGELPVNSFFRQIDQQPDFYFYDANVKATWQPSHRDHVTLSYYAGEDNLRTSSAYETEADTLSGGNLAFTEVGLSQVEKWGNRGLSLRWKHQWNQRHHTVLSIANSSFYRDNLASYTTATAFDNPAIPEQETEFSLFKSNRLEEAKVKVEHRFLIDPFNSLTLGLFTTENEVNFLYEVDTVAESIVDSTGARGGFFASWQHDWQKGQLRLGFRNTALELAGRAYLEPRFSFGQDLSDRVRVGVSAGHYVQMVNYVSINDALDGDTRIWLTPDDEEIPVLRSNNIAGSIRYKHKDWLLSAEAYFRSFDGILEYFLDQTDFFIGPDDAFSSPFLQGSGKSQGLEFLVHRNWGSVESWISYSLSQTIHEFALLNRGLPFPARYDQRHQLKAVAVWQKNRWNLSSSFVWSSGRPYTQPLTTYTVTLIDGRQLELPDVPLRNNGRLPDYHRLDLNASYSVPVGKKNNLLVGASVFNLYNRQNLRSRNFYLDDSGEVLRRDVVLLGFSPSLSLTFTF